MDRVLRHALGCLVLGAKDPILFDDVITEAIDKSLGAKLGLKDKDAREIRAMALKLANLRPTKKVKGNDGQAQLPAEVLWLLASVNGRRW